MVRSTLTPLAAPRPVQTAVSTAAAGLLNLSETHFRTGMAWAGNATRAANSSFSSQSPTTEAPAPGPGLGLPLQIFLCAAMAAVLLMALLGNAVVCLMVYRRSAMRSAINILLASLALADALLAALNMPLALVTVVTTRWVFGEAVCRLSAMLFWLFVAEGSAILLIISVDRFLIIVRKQDKLSPRRAQALAAASWALALALSLPLALGRPPLQVPPRAPQCVFGYSADPAYRAYVVALTLAFFAVPFAAMLYAFLGILSTLRHNAVRVHGRSDGKRGPAGPRRTFRTNVDVGFKTRAFATILILFSVFTVCWAPFAAYGLAATFSRAFYAGDGFFRTSAWLLWLCYLRPALNPLIYYWQIKKFRDACVDLMPKYFSFLPRLPGNAKRRIQPSAVYVCGEHTVV
ncbi:hypothetical protein NHX12_026659 [Muraenolepis orangiensis]|uniref:G-protein coupled receptors family 1 profile domain-containing protein n=1 Tax=Muraenolepis orangiensis TaxID=630683 RepID=A0A9Q0EKL9_9TELE|nr:hypothetical protein NHX12_026659 [Muraenolepis orangiensis]